MEDVKHVMTDMVGAELTEPNLSMIEAKLTAALRHDGEPEPPPDLHPHERKWFAALQEVLNVGQVELAQFPGESDAG